LKKRTKKLLLPRAASYGACFADAVLRAKGIKVFWFFSSEKNIFLHQRRNKAWHSSKRHR
jgi:hypothetical protein